jgi:hypothetical protein
MKGAFSIKSKKTPYQVRLAWLSRLICHHSATHAHCMHDKHPADFRKNTTVVVVSLDLSFAEA